MRKARCVTGAILAVAAFALPTSSALGAAPPSAGSPGCTGLIVAEFNHNSIGASGNPNASAGPGYFLRQGTAAAVHAVQGSFCP